MARDKQRIDALKAIPMFEELSNKDLDRLSRMMTPLSVSAGKKLVSQGDIGREAIIIESGTASVVSNGEKIADLGPGDFFGEMSLISDMPRNADVEATSDMEVLVMSSSEFSSVLDSDPSVAVTILRTVVDRLVANEARTI